MKKLDKAAQERKKKGKEKLQMVGGVNASEAQQHIIPHGKKKNVWCHDYRAEAFWSDNEDTQSKRHGYRVTKQCK